MERGRRGREEGGGRGGGGGGVEEKHISWRNLVEYTVLVPSPMFLWLLLISLNIPTSLNRITRHYGKLRTKPFLKNGIFCGVCPPKIANRQSPQSQHAITSYTPNIPTCTTFSQVWKELTPCFLNIITHWHVNTWGSAFIPYPTSPTYISIPLHRTRVTHDSV